MRGERRARWRGPGDAAERACWAGGARARDEERRELGLAGKSWAAEGSAGPSQGKGEGFGPGFGLGVGLLFYLFFSSISNSNKV